MASTSALPAISCAVQTENDLSDRRAVYDKVDNFTRYKLIQIVSIYTALGGRFACLPL